MSSGKGTESGSIDRLKLAMAARCCSIRSLSNDTDIPYRTLQNYLAKRHSMPIEVLGKLCRRLSISADWVLHDGLFLPHHDLVDALIRAGLIKDPQSDEDRIANQTAAIFLEGAMNLINDSQLFPRRRKFIDAIEKQASGESHPKGIELGGNEPGATAIPESNTRG
ncbi:MAG: helix-turn-helix transcriptional regulator [Alphaproteobacteria bacterium]|nr:helix-turn-helix transcriptional regulator [Alphaproteobacteria bacterium]